MFSRKLCVSQMPSAVLTYKLSQDHLELFFSSVRTRGGFNNNPTARQFTAAYKRLLVKLQVRTGTGNCILRDNASILGTTPAAANTLRRYDLKPVEHAEPEHDYHLLYAQMLMLFLSTRKLTSTTLLALLSRRSSKSTTACPVLKR